MLLITKTVPPQQIHDLSINSDVLLWREGNIGKVGSWRGPYKLVSQDGESCIVELPSGPTPFRSTVVKLFLQDPLDPAEPSHPIQQTPLTGIQADTPADSLAPIAPLASAPAAPLKRGRQRPRKTMASLATTPAVLPKRGRGRLSKYPRDPADTPQLIVFLQDNFDINLIEILAFEESCNSQIIDLLEKDVFQFVSKSKVTPNIRLFSSKFVNIVKNKESTLFERSRWVIQAYKNSEK
jgi:hypothetical protein